MLQTCGLGRASSDTSKNFRFEVQTCSWKTVIGASCPPAPQSYRCHVILTEPRGRANQIFKDENNSLELTRIFKENLITDSEREKKLTDDGVDAETSLSLSLCISISLLRLYTFYSRSLSVIKFSFSNQIL